MSSLAHIATRIFGTPLLIERGKMDVILGALGPRLGVVAEDDAADVKLYGPGDTGRDRKPYFVTEDKLAIIDVVGPLVKRNSGNFLSGGPTTYIEVENEFTDAITDPAIRGILLQVDSPGGECTGCFELADLIHSQRGAKPIYAVADGDAFSAAYAIASSADKLFVTKSGGVGSIGVWMMHVDQSRANEKAGLTPTYIFAGARKIDGNPHEPLTKEARGAFQAEVDRIYVMFVDTVARNRNLATRAVRATEAGLFFGTAAVDEGLADVIGGFSDALAALRVAADTKRTTGATVTAGAHTNRKEIHMEEQRQDEAVAEEAAVEQETAPAEPAEKESDPPPAETVAESTAGAAAQIAELCVLAGMPGMIAGFLRAGATLEAVRHELLQARAAADEESQIHSRVLPETGATGDGLRAKNETIESPIVRAAEKLANEGKKE